MKNDASLSCDYNSAVAAKADGRPCSVCSSHTGALLQVQKLVLHCAESASEAAEDSRPARRRRVEAAQADDMTEDVVRHSKAFRDYVAALNTT